MAELEERQLMAGSEMHCAKQGQVVGTSG